MNPTGERLLPLLLACVTLLCAVAAAAQPACFTESQFASTCEPPVRVASSGGGIRGCFRPDLLRPPGADAGESVTWDAASDVCERRPTGCGDIAGCPVAANAGRCLVSCDVAERGFLALSIRAGVGVKSFDLINTSSLSNGSVVRGAPGSASLLPDLFRASAIDELPAVVPRLTFKEAIVQLFVNESVVVNVTFDLSRSPHELSRTNWFSQDRVKASWPVTDLASRSFNFFSIVGDAPINRRWFINYMYDGCPLDLGFMLSLDVTDGCAWAGNVTSPPKLMYNIQPNSTWGTSGHLADKLTVILR